MMRFLLAMTIVVGASLPALAGQGAWQRVCRIAGGFQWVLNIHEPHKELPLCVFGEAAVGSEAFFEHTVGGPERMALIAYKRGLSDCSFAGGYLVEGIDSNMQSFTICKFADGSLIEEGTLLRGPGHPFNTSLDAALSSKY